VAALDSEARPEVKRACIDTHALVWYLTAPRRLGRGAARWLRDAEAGRAEILVPAIVPVELVLLREAGRRLVGPAELLALFGAQSGIALIGLDLDQAFEFGHLVGITELFDRLIVATARSCDAPLITRDAEIIQSQLVETVWD
jgi:PIN domain nuclease of toxin-antitoxin system